MGYQISNMPRSLFGSEKKETLPSTLFSNLPFVFTASLLVLENLICFLTDLPPFR